MEDKKMSSVEPSVGEQSVGEHIATTAKQFEEMALDPELKGEEITELAKTVSLKTPFAEVAEVLARRRDASSEALDHLARVPSAALAVATNPNTGDPTLARLVEHRFTDRSVMEAVCSHAAAREGACTKAAIAVLPEGARQRWGEALQAPPVPPFAADPSRPETTRKAAKALSDETIGEKLAQARQILAIANKQGRSGRTTSQAKLDIAALTAEARERGILSQGQRPLGQSPLGQSPLDQGTESPKRSSSPAMRGI